MFLLKCNCPKAICRCDKRINFISVKGSEHKLVVIYEFVLDSFLTYIY